MVSRLTVDRDTPTGGCRPSAPGDLAKLSHALRLIHPPGRPHQRWLSALAARVGAVRAHCADLVVPTPLYRHVASKHGVDRGPRAFEPVAVA